MDWIACLLTLLSVELTARKMWQGWLIGLFSQNVYVCIEIENGL